MSAAMTEQPSGKVKMVQCSNCGRSFAEERIGVHQNICNSHKERKVFNVAEQRVHGTEAEELLKTGKLQLEAPRPELKKTELSNRVKSGRALPGSRAPLPPIGRKATARNKTQDGKVKAYQVVFDADDKMKTKRSTKFPQAVPPNRASALPRSHVDDRYLSATRARGRWQSAAHKTGSAPSLGTMMSSDEEQDFLTASMTSRKTVQSDAFDFLFDSENLNPEKVLDHDALEKLTEEKMREQNSRAVGAGGALDKNTVKESACCVVS